MVCSTCVVIAGAIPSFQTPELYGARQNKPSTLQEPPRTTTLKIGRSICHGSDPLTNKTKVIPYHPAVCRGPPCVTAATPTQPDASHDSPTIAQCQQKRLIVISTLPLPVRHALTHAQIRGSLMSCSSPPAPLLGWRLMRDREAWEIADVSVLCGDCAG